MDNVLFVQVLESHDDLGCDEFYSLFREPLDLEKIVVDVAARNVPQEEVDPRFI
jgi:hypothetical protein